MNRYLVRTKMTRKKVNVLFFVCPVSHGQFVFQSQKQKKASRIGRYDRVI
jgi:hypothetical protein